MDARVFSSGRLKDTYRRISQALALVVLEWLLMMFLFIDASFSYFVTKFARLCGLQIPCLLCSRLDHVIGKEKKGFYWDLICHDHKLEISSRVFCHVHNKLVDVQEMCENCLFSFATVNKFNAETYRLLVGKLEADPSTNIDQDLLDEIPRFDFSKTKVCSCCRKQWTSKGFTENQLRTTSVVFSAFTHDRHDESLPINTERPVDEMRKTIDKSSMSRRTRTRNISCDPLSHVKYSEVKITSDNVPEIPHYNDRSNALSHEADHYIGSETVHCVPDDSSSGISSHEAFPLKPSGSESDPLLNPLESVIATSIDNGSKEFHRQNAKLEFDVPSPSDLISFDEVPPCDVPNFHTTAPDELISVYEVPSSSVASTPVKVTGKPLSIPQADDLGQENAAENEVIAKVEREKLTTIETRLTETSVVADTALFMPSYIDLGDAYKLAVGNTRRQLSGKFLEQRSMKDSTKLSEDLKMLLSQISAARGLELPLYDISPRVSGNFDDMKSSDSSISTGIHLLQRRISLERNESGLSIDGSIVSEIEGESVIDRLKRQVEHDRKILGALYRELEEERNASAVATNQAMAMITRLQEEKSALHMEALQCIRMMEEQAEYDAEALQGANDVIEEKEKEIKDLEAIVELYKERIGNESLVDINTKPKSDILMGVENAESTCTETDIISNNNSTDPQNSLSGFADER